MDKKFIILADITCDLGKELLTKYDIEIIPGTFTHWDGTEEESIIDWADCKHIPDCTREAFYTSLKKHPNDFKTAPASVQKFYERFEKYINDGYGVMYVAISSALSGAYDFSLIAKKQIDEAYPDAEVYCIDSRRYASAIGLLCLKAAELRAEGKSLKETVDFIENNKIKYHQAGWLDDLSFVAKKGRMSNAKAFFGSLIGIKPIGDLDSNGLTTVIGKVKGEKLAYKVLLEYIDALQENIENQIVLISQSNRYEQAMEFKRLIEERFHPREVIVGDVYPQTGINVGPGLMAAYFMGKPISEGLVDEREAINKAIESCK